MDNIKVRCRNCNSEIKGDAGRIVCCGCNNLTTIKYNTTITAVDLSKVVMLNTPNKEKKSTHFSHEDLQYHVERNKRKVKRLDFEIR